MMSGNLQQAERRALIAPIEAALDKEWKSREEDLHDIEGLTPDWDGMGADAPQPELVTSARELLRFLKAGNDWVPPSSIVASPNGAVVFEWQLGQLYIEAEISQPSCSEWMLIENGHPAEHWTFAWGASAPHD